MTITQANSLDLKLVLPLGFVERCAKHIYCMYQTLCIIFVTNTCTLQTSIWCCLETLVPTWTIPVLHGIVQKTLLGLFQNNMGLSQNAYFNYSSNALSCTENYSDYSKTTQGCPETLTWDYSRITRGCPESTYLGLFMNHIRIYRPECYYSAVSQSTLQTLNYCNSQQH